MDTSPDKIELCKLLQDDVTGAEIAAMEFEGTYVGDWKDGMRHGHGV